MRNINILLLSLMFVGAAKAAEPSDGRVKALMHTFLIEISKIDEILNSDQTFSSASGKASVGEALAHLERKTQNPPAALQNTPGFRITFDLLANHIARTKEAFDGGEYQYARMRILGTPGLCASCHTQTPQPGKFSQLSFLRKRIDNTSLNNANFLFVFRRYDEALAQYDSLVRGYPESGLGSAALDELYRKKLSIFARVKRDPEAAIKNFKKDLENKNLPLDVRKNIEVWLGEFAKWRTEKDDPAKMSTDKMVSYVEKSIPSNLTRNIAPSHPEAMTLLRLSGLLYERLYREKDGVLIQQLLYNLAQCERSLGPSYWYPLSEIYLKECIVRHPKGKYSSRCFQAYEQGMQERYSGKSIPEPVRLSLEALKGYL